MTSIKKDTLWKGIIEDLFEDFCHYFFPKWATQIADFTKPPEFLDKELDEIYPEESPTKRYADKLVKVFTKGGTPQWILIHIEVQGYKDAHFAQRMFIYFQRILDRYKHKVMALAILTDDDPNFRPQQYVYQYGQTRNTYEFPSFKILEKTEQDLQVLNNPFSIVMLTAKKALSRQNLSDHQQFIWKKSLVMALRKGNYSDRKIRGILHFIRSYVKFNTEDNSVNLDKEIQIIFKQRQNMGIEEAIREEYKKAGLEEGTQKTKIRGIQRALQQRKLSLEEIADLFEVSVDFVRQVQKEML